MSSEYPNNMSGQLYTTHSVMKSVVCGWGVHMLFFFYQLLFFRIDSETWDRLNVLVRVSIIMNRHYDHNNS